jgi:glutamine synthetase
VSDVVKIFAEQKANFARWEILKDVIDQQIDLMLNYRQSGHPGGSRSKVHALLATLLSGAMRWDIRNPEKRFGDRFVDWLVHIKQAEISRFLSEVTDWEQREYFDIF